jgi:integrase
MTTRKKTGIKFWVEKKGKLYARFQYTDEAGKRREKYRAITDKRKARSAVEDMRREVRDHGSIVLQSDRMKFRDLLDYYRENVLIEAVYVDGRKVSGRRSIAPVKSFLKPLEAFFGNRAIRDIKVSDLEVYKRQRLDTPVVTPPLKEKVPSAHDSHKSPNKDEPLKSSGTRRKISSVNRELEALRQLLNFAVENDWLMKNPFHKRKGIISKASENERNRILTVEEEERLLMACTGRREHLRPIVICALDTAMRRGEMFKMKWKDVNFITGEISIPQTNTKTEVARVVGMTARLRSELRTLQNRAPENRLGLVFGITDTIKVAWKSACAQADIVDFRLHDCRHTATTRMIMSGSPHTQVMKITGHSQMKTFLRYLTITSETANVVANRLDSFIERTKPSKQLEGLAN